MCDQDDGFEFVHDDSGKLKLKGKENQPGCYHCQLMISGKGAHSLKGMAYWQCPECHQWYANYAPHYQGNDWQPRTYEQIKDMREEDRCFL